eukprot:GHVU01125316.1.p1 GENE.GHVU01125316.1~~GHVU01125316.1.p1  ORF type:complete len:114 (+),score=10.31 GHVU01125316.1:635-976(+)
MDVSMSLVDYLVFAGTIIASLGIGLYFAFTSKNSSTESYYMGNRQGSIFPVAASLVVTNLSTISVLGVSAEIYYFGGESAFHFICMPVAALIAAFTFVPLLHEMKLTSVFEVI